MGSEIANTLVSVPLAAEAPMGFVDIIKSGGNWLLLGGNVLCVWFRLRGHCKPEGGPRVDNKQTTTLFFVRQPS